MSLAKRLLNSTANLEAAVAAKSGNPQDQGARPQGPRTAPGHMLAARDEILGLQGELRALQEKLANFDGSIPTVKLDPTRVQVSRWANRHEAAFEGAAFLRLKTSIEQAGGNVQPILVRRADADKFEVVFGHRRLRACAQLGIPVLAAIWEGSMSDLDLFMSMDRENREREDLSPYEQGAMYASALENGLFPSQRRLAETLGLSHTWVRRTINVAQLPPAIVEAFGSPLAIQTIHAEAINSAMDTDRKGVLRRAERLRLAPKKLAPARVVEHLLGQATESTRPQAIESIGRPVGSWKRNGAGRVVITLERDTLSDEQLQEVLKRIGDLASGAPAT